MKERSHETKQDGSNLKQATTMTSTNINKQQRYRSHQKKKKDRETVCVCVVLCDNGGYTNMKKEKKEKTHYASTRAQKKGKRNKR